METALCKDGAALGEDIEYSILGIFLIMILKKRRLESDEKSNHEEKKTDVEECRDKINALLEEYNCSLHSSDEFSWVYLQDNDNGDTAGDLK